MPRQTAQPDVLVLGDHPSAYLAATLLREKPPLRVMHSTIPGDTQADRLVLVSAALFGLHKALDPIKRKLGLTGLWGAAFLADDGKGRSEFRGRTVMAYVTGLDDLRERFRELAGQSGAILQTPATLAVRLVDETGVEVQLGRETIKPRAIVLAGHLPQREAQVLGLPEAWPAAQLHRYAWMRLRGGQWTDLPSRPLLPMSLDLMGQLAWAWMLPGKGEVQLLAESPGPGLEAAALGRWVEVLKGHGLLRDSPIPDVGLETVELPLAGALERECVASRTLLIGPAGGFYAASAEDVYPNCWSAVYAAEVLRKALKERHLQDALQPYRQRWGATLGEYLRGPQQNLRFLLPLIYRNQAMTQRLTESILLGKQVVR
jgi:flavin-dependent dehydrogenase